MSLKERAFSAVRWNTAAAVTRGVLQLAQIAVMARLLIPADYGLMAMVTVMLAFASIFMDMGVNSAYVQRQDVTEGERSSLFWLNLSISVVLTLLVILLSSHLARWLGDARLTPLFMLAASTFVINALGQQVRMDAQKTLNFRSLVLVELASMVLGIVAAGTTAWAGWGVYALILGAIVNSLACTVFAWVFLAGGWRPLWRFRMAEVHRFLSFGSMLVANNLINEANRNLDLLLGGRLLGPDSLGLFSLPRQIIFHIQNLVNPIITRPGFPLIAQAQADIGRVRTIYLKTLNMTAAINAPLYLGLAFFAPEVIETLLGQKWLTAAELLPVLAIWGYLRSCGSPVGSLLLGMGRADLSLKWNLAMLMVVLPVLLLGSQFGTLGLAWSLLAFQLAMFLPIWHVLVRSLCEASLVEYTVATLRPLFLAIVSIGPAYWLAHQFDGVVLRLGIGILLASPLYLAVSYKANRDWIDAMKTLAKFDS